MTKANLTPAASEKAPKTAEKDPKGIFQKLLALQKRVKALQKDSQSYGYDYLSGDKLWGIVRPAMDELGLLLIPTIKSMTQEAVEYQVWDRTAKQLVTKRENMCILEITFTWVDVEDGETLEQSWRGTGQNGFDKSFGSALTYAERYFLLKTFHIATDRDDVDAIAAVRDEAVEKASIEVAKQQQASRKDSPVPATAEKAPLFPDVNALSKDKEFFQWAELAAKGGKSRSGKPAREAWINKYNPTPEQLEYFESMVANKKAILEVEKEGFEMERNK